MFIGFLCWQAQFDSTAVYYCLISLFTAIEQHLLDAKYHNAPECLNFSRDI